MNEHEYREWADVREADYVVATAIHAIATDERTADDIWADPTTAEKEKIKILVGKFIDMGLFWRHENGKYCWGSDFFNRHCFL